MYRVSDRPFARNAKEYRVPPLAGDFDAAIGEKPQRETHCGGLAEAADALYIPDLERFSRREFREQALYARNRLSRNASPGKVRGKGELDLGHVDVLTHTPVPSGIMP